ncbi:MAG: hypothetical protein GY913_26530 [Proteobacteria bacterium]|nr:hypothetical protein [Pseudomonadota bacterium]MCP4920474.1 hypothetical protein [Pseudomonadota bacterium]
MLLLLACADPTALGDLPVHVKLAESIPTVARLTWDEGPATVEIRLDGALVQEFEGDGTALVVGLGPQRSYGYTVQHDDGRTQSGVISTGNVPTDIPEMDVETFGEPLDSGFIIGTFVSAASGPLILDHEGTPVWWFKDARDDILVVRAWLLPDGSGVVFGTSTNDIEAEGRVSEIIEVDWEQTSIHTIQVPGFHHDFALLPDGYAAIVSDKREIEGRLVTGDSIVEVHGDDLETIWTSWDDRPWTEELAKTPEMLRNYTHANAVDYSEELDAYTLSIRNLNTVVHVDAQTGEEQWAIGEHGTLVLVGEAERRTTLEQHQFDLDGDSLLVFDNGTTDDLDSRVVEYTLDTEGGTAEEVDTYRTEPELFNYALGNVARLPDGARLVTWSTGGQLEKVSPDGTLEWRLNTEIGAALGYMEWVPTLH